MHIQRIIVPLLLHNKGKGVVLMNHFIMGKRRTAWGKEGLAIPTHLFLERNKTLYKTNELFKLEKCCVDVSIIDGQENDQVFHKNDNL